VRRTGETDKRTDGRTDGRTGRNCTVAYYDGRTMNKIKYCDHAVGWRLVSKCRLVYSVSLTESFRAGICVCSGLAAEAPPTGS